MAKLVAKKVEGNDFDILVRNLYTTFGKDLTPQVMEHIKATYGNGKEMQFVKNFYTTFHEKLTPEVLNHIQTTYLKKKVSSPSSGIPLPGSSQSSSGGSSDVPLTNSPLNPYLPESENAAAQENAFSPNVEQSINGSVKVAGNPPYEPQNPISISPIESLNGWMKNTLGDVTKAPTYPVINPQQKAQLLKQRADLAKGLYQNPYNQQEINHIDSTLSLYSPTAKNIFKDLSKSVGNDNMNWFITPQQQHEVKQQLLAKYGDGNEAAIDNAIKFYDTTKSRKAFYNAGLELNKQEGITPQQTDVDYKMAANSLVSNNEQQAEELYSKIKQQFTSPTPNEEEITKAAKELERLGYNPNNWKDYTPGYRIVKKNEKPSGYDNLVNNYINHYVNKSGLDLQTISKQNYVIQQALLAKYLQLEPVILQINKNKLNSMLPKENAQPLKPVVVTSMKAGDYNAKPTEVQTILNPSDPSYQENVNRLEQQFNIVKQKLEQSQAAFEASVRAQRIKQQGEIEPNVDTLLKEYEEEKQQYEKEPVSYGVKLKTVNIKAHPSTSYWYNLAKHPNADFNKLPVKTQKFLMSIARLRESDVTSGDALDVPEIRENAPESYIKAVELQKKEAKIAGENREKKAEWFKSHSINTLAEAASYQNPEIKLVQQPYMSGQLGAMTTPEYQYTGKPSEKQQQETQINKYGETIGKLSRYATLLEGRIQDKSNPDLQDDINKYKEVLTAYYKTLSKYEKEIKGYKGKLKEFPYYVPYNDVHILSKLTGLSVGFFDTLNSSVLGKLVNAVIFGNPDFRNYDPSGLTKAAHGLIGLVWDAPLFWGIGELAGGLTDAVIKGMSRVKITEGIANSINELSDATSKLVEEGMKPSDALAKAASEFPKDALKVKTALMAIKAVKGGMLLGTYNAVNEALTDALNVRNAVPGSKVKYKGDLYTIFQSNGDKVRMIDENGNEKELTRAEYDKYVQASYKNVGTSAAVGAAGGALMPLAGELSDAIMKGLKVTEAAPNTIARGIAQAYALAAAGSWIKYHRSPDVKEIKSAMIFVLGMEGGSKLFSILKGNRPFAKKFFKEGSQQELTKEEFISNVMELSNSLDNPDFLNKINNAVQKYVTEVKAQKAVDGVADKVINSDGKVIHAVKDGKPVFIAFGAKVGKDGKVHTEGNKSVIIETINTEKGELEPMLVDPKDLKIGVVQDGEEFKRELKDAILKKGTDKAVEGLGSLREPSSDKSGTTIPNEGKVAENEVPENKKETTVKTEGQPVKESGKDHIVEPNKKVEEAGEKVKKPVEEPKVAETPKEVKQKAATDKTVKKAPTKEPWEMSPKEYEKYLEDKKKGLKFSLNLTSPTEDALTSIKQPKGEPAQMKADLLHKGAKQAELDWMGWDDFVKGKNKLTKEEIQDWIKNNKVELEEVVKGDIENKWVKEGNVLRYGNYEIEKNINGQWSLKETGEHAGWIGNYTTLDGAKNFVEANAEDKNTNTKYSQYKTPGGTNYREFLLTMPEKRTQDTYSAKEVNGRWFVVNDRTGDELYTPKNWTREQAEAEAKGRTNTIKESGGKYDTKANFKSPHFDEPNIVVHTRTQDFKDKSGDDVLHLDEVQSDWAQKGKKRGFKKEYKSIPEGTIIKKAEVPKGWPENLYDVLLPNGEQLSVRADEEKNVKDRVLKAINSQQSHIPDMPFKKTPQWVGLALKRMVQEAAENGYDAVTWTTGEQQAERYDLSKQINSLTYNKERNILMLWDKNNNVQEPIEVGIDKLSDYVGKDVAEKIQKNKDNLVELSGLDLKVGGEGMHAFYDKILPKTAEKLFKKYGAKVEKTTIIGEDGQEHEAWKLKLTDKLKEAANDGFPIFKLETRPESGDTKDYDNEVRSQIKKIARDIGAKVHIVDKVEDLPSNISREIKKQGVGDKVKGVYDEKTGDIYVVQSKINSTEDARRLLLHEAVGHKGMRLALGKDYRQLLRDVYDQMDEGDKKHFRDIYSTRDSKGNIVRPDLYTIADEYLASKAEKAEKTTWLQDIYARIRNIIRKTFGLKYSDNDINYLFKLSKKALSKEGNLNEIEKHVKFSLESDKEHKALVRKALEEGKPVPDRVLDYYPDLKEEFSKDKKEEVKAEPDKGKGLTGVSKRVREIQAKEGKGIVSPQSGKSYSPDELVKMGHDKYNEMTQKERDDFIKSLEDRLSHGILEARVNEIERMVARAHNTQLQADYERAYDLGDKEAAKEALKKWNDFKQKVIEPLGTKWHIGGMAQQGVEDMESGHLKAFMDYFAMTHKRPITQEEIDKYAKDASELRKSHKADEDDLKKMFTKGYGDGKGTRKPVSSTFRDVADEIAKIRKQLHKSGTLQMATPLSLTLEAGLLASEGVFRAAAEGVDAATTIAKAIKAGVDAMKKSKWYKQLTEDDAKKAEDELTAVLNKSLVKKGVKADTKENLAEEVKGKHSFTTQEARKIWLYAKENYINKHTSTEWTDQEYQDVLNSVSKDLGITPDDVKEAIAQPKTEINISPEKKKLQTIQRRFLTTARNDFMNTERGQRMMEERRKKFEKGLPELQAEFANRKGNKFTIDERRRIWDYVKNYFIDLGVTDLHTILKGVSIDLGLTPKQALDIIGNNKSYRKITTEMWDRATRRRRIVNAAKAEMDYGDSPMFEKVMRKIPRFFFAAKVFGHFGVGGMTHAGMYVFTFLDWGRYIKNFLKQYRLAVDPRYYERQMQLLKLKPHYNEWVRSNLGIEPERRVTDYEIFGRLLEGSNAGKLIKSINESGTRGFSMLKLLRYDVAENLYKHWSSGVDKAGEESQRELRDLIAAYVNASTGVSSIKFSERNKGYDEALSAAFFAWRLEMSRWHRLIKDPYNAVKYAFSDDPAKRAISHIILTRALQHIFTYGSALALNQALLKLSGSKEKVNYTNPFKPDFLRFKTRGGNTLIMSAGMVSAIRLVSSMVYALNPKSTPLVIGGKLEPKRTTLERVSINYGFNKVSPIVEEAISLLTGTNFNGQEIRDESQRTNIYQRKVSGLGLFLENALPIPGAEAYTVYHNELQKERVKEVQEFLKGEINSLPKQSRSILWKSIVYGAITGFTGARIGDYNGGVSPFQAAIEKDNSQQHPDVIHGAKVRNTAIDLMLGNEKPFIKNLNTGEFGLSDLRKLTKYMQTKLAYDVNKASVESLVKCFPKGNDNEKAMTIQTFTKKYLSIQQRWKKLSPKQMEHYTQVKNNFVKELKGYFQELKAKEKEK